MPFADRAEAGKRLAAALEKYRDARPAVLALPRGGVPVGAEIAAALGAPLDLVLVRKIGLPGQPELAMGAVVDGDRPIVVRNEDVMHAVGVSQAGFDAVCRAEMKEIERRRRRYMAGRAPVDVSGRTAIVVDDGVATGATMRSALRAVRTRGPAGLVLAVPVAPTDTLSAMQGEADAIVCLESYPFFGAIGAYYRDFDQLGDEEVIALLDAAAARQAGRR
jgi:predicted phosphoribosyltransferase